MILNKINLKNMKIKFRKKGFALLFALVGVSIILVVALAISRISFQEIRISDIEQDSQVALNATNSGAECAMFWDRRAESIFGVESQIECSEGVVSDIDEIEPKVYFFVASFSDGQCAYVTVDKSGMPENKTVIESRGYNICPDGEERNSRRVERAVLVEYEYGGGDDVTLEADISIVVDTVGGMSGQADSGLSKFEVLQQTLAKFAEEMRPLTSTGDVQLGLTEFQSNANILSMLTSDIDIYLDKIALLSTGSSQNAAGGVFLGTDVITGNLENLIQNNNQPVTSGRDGVDKFIILVSGGHSNQNSVVDGVARGQKQNNVLSADEQFALAVDEAIDKGIVVITFGVGTAPSVDHDWMRENIASDSSQWERCADFEYGVCYFEVNKVEDLEDVFNLRTIFGGGYLHWQPI